MINRILSEPELAAHIEDLAGCEARRDVAERLAADAYADGVRTIAELDARWPEDAPFFSCYAAAADEIDGASGIADCITCKGSGVARRSWGADWSDEACWCLSARGAS